MNEPLWSETAADARARELLAQFDREPDVLSPDEQALVMALQSLIAARDGWIAIAKHRAAEVTAYHVAVTEHRRCNSYDCGNCVGAIEAEVKEVMATVKI